VNPFRGCRLDRTLADVSFYRNHALYSAFFEPSEEMRDSINTMVRTHVGPKPKRVLDPACGPGLWLEHFAGRGSTVVGIELDAAVAEAGQRRLAGRKALVVQGDMRDPPESIKGPFDLAINLDNSLGHLGGVDDVVSHFRAVHRLLGPKGVYLVGLAVREKRATIKAETVFERGPLPIAGGGYAAIRSETHGLQPAVGPDRLRCERIRHYVMTVGIEGLAPLFIEQYDLLTFPIDTLKIALAHGGPWKVADCRDATDESLPKATFEAGCGDVLLALRPVAARTATVRKRGLLRR
jgi:SAM-dependent methyltransferase